MPLRQAFPGKQFRKLAPCARLVETVHMTKGMGPVSVASLTPKAKQETADRLMAEWLRLDGQLPFEGKPGYATGHVYAAALADKLNLLQGKILIRAVNPKAFTPKDAVFMRTLAHESFLLVKRLERSGIVGMRNGDYKKPIAEVLENIRDICMEIPNEIIRPN